MQVDYMGANNMHDWPSILSSLLIQGSVGLVFISAIYSLSTRVILSPTQNVILFRAPLTIAAIFGLLGLLLSSLSSSAELIPMSRLSNTAFTKESMTTGIYLVLLGFMVIALYVTKRVRPLYLFTVGLVGLIAVFCMANLYFHSSVITWAHYHTFVSFFGTTFSLGAALTLLLLVPILLQMQQHSLNFLLMVIATLLIFASFAIRVMEIGHYEAAIGFASTLSGSATVELAYFNYSYFNLAAWVMLGVSTFLLFIGTLRARKHPLVITHLVFTGGLIVAAELFLRMVFFTVG